MRDLAADLAEFNHWMCNNYDTYDPTLMWFSGVLPEAITRAIKAEDRVDTLQIVAKENYRMYENTLNEVEKWHNEYKAFRDASDVWRKIAVDKNAENARLRRVVDAAREIWWGAEQSQWKALEQAFVELDKEDER